MSCLRVVAAEDPWRNCVSESLSMRSKKPANGAWQIDGVAPCADQQPTVSSDGPKKKVQMH